MIFFMTAGVSAVLLSALTFDPELAAYWRRWLGRPGYLGRRSLLMLPPLVLALALCHFARPPADPVAEAVNGLWVGLTVAAVLKADPRPRNVPKLRRTADSRQAASALTWIYGIACHRFDVAAQRKLTAHLTRLKRLGSGSAELVTTAEEIAALLAQEAAAAPAKARTVMQERLEEMRKQINVLEDPMATEPQLRRTAFELAESLQQEMTTRRWNRQPVRPHPERKP